MAARQFSLAYLMRFLLVVGCNCSHLKAQLRWRFKMADGQSWQLMPTVHRELSLHVAFPVWWSQVVGTSHIVMASPRMSSSRAEAVEPFLS